MRLQSMTEDLNNPILPLFDYEHFVPRLEATFVQIIEKYDHQNPPDLIVM